MHAMSANGRDLHSHMLSSAGQGEAKLGVTPLRVSTISHVGFHLVFHLWPCDTWCTACVILLVDPLLTPAFWSAILSAGT